MLSRTIVTLKLVSNFHWRWKLPTKSLVVLRTTWIIVKYKKPNLCNTVREAVKVFGVTIHHGLKSEGVAPKAFLHVKHKRVQYIKNGTNLQRQQTHINLFSLPVVTIYQPLSLTMWLQTQSRPLTSSMVFAAPDYLQI